MYLKHFDLREYPFGLTPDVDFLYLAGQQQSALQTLLVSLKHGEGFIKVTGEVGTGKTLLCRKLMDMLSDRVRCVYIFNPRLSPAGLLHTIAHELDMQVSYPKNEAVLYRIVVGRLCKLASEGKRVVCCIDEAHALRPAALEALRLLSNLETSKHKLLQVVLFGQPELDDLLRTPVLRSLASRISFGACLKGLSMSEFQHYLQYRMRVAGWDGTEVFSKSVSFLLWRLSNGIPRIANVLAHQCLMLAYGRGEYSVTMKDVLTVGHERWRLLGNPWKPVANQALIERQI